MRIKPRQTFTVAEIQAPGAIQQIWMTTFPGFWRSAILQMCWDGEAPPSVETPIGDFFGAGWTERCRMSSLPAKHYLPLQDDIASTAFWYQIEPHASFPALPAHEELDVI